MFSDIFTLNGRWNRLNRLRYFLYSLAVFGMIIAFSFILGFILGMVGNAEMLMEGGGIMILVIQGISIFFAIWTGVCLGVKRLHDLDKTGWLWLIFLIPIIGFIFSLYLLFAPGTSGKNRFGPDPLGV